jgi:hypothetical protein
LAYQRLRDVGWCRVEAGLRAMILSESARGRLGFYFGSSGAHAGRSLMLEDLDVLLRRMPKPLTRAACRTAIIEQNLLAKATYNNRDHVNRRMGQLYALDDSVCLFRNFYRLWELDPASLALSALLLALARDGLLRATTSVVINASLGTELDRKEFAAVLDGHLAGRMSKETLQHAVSNILRTWQATGHVTTALPGRRQRSAMTAGPGAMAFALFLGWLEGARGENLFRTSWAQVLDRSMADCIELATVAARRGMLDFLNAGGVMELRFPGYLTSREEALE